MPRVVDAEERRAAITDAAARVIAHSGIEAATMREVAAEAGWTTGAITHYFANKHELLLATFQASLAHRRSQRLPPSASPAERLRATLEGALPVDESRRRHWLVTLACCVQASGEPSLGEAQRDAYREFRAHVADLAEAAALADSATKLTVAEQMIAGIDGVAVQALFDPESWPAARQIEAVDAIVPAILKD